MIRVLVVDDDPMAAPLLKAALKGDFSVTAETSGAQAIESAESAQPDLILLDLHMPNIDGYEVLRKLKAHPSISAPVICVSGDLEQASRDRAAELGAVAYFQKPLEFKRLGADIQSILHTLNVSLHSPTERIHFTIAYNRAEKYRRMHEVIAAAASNGRQSLVISLLNGEDFEVTGESKAMADGSCVYLQMSPSTLAKFPYLQDLAPLIEDIQAFVPEKKLSELDLHFDDPQLLLGLGDPRASKAAFARLHLLKDTLAQSFSTCHLYCSREGMGQALAELNEMALTFCR